MNRIALRNPIGARFARRRVAAFVMGMAAFAIMGVSGGATAAGVPTTLDSWPAVPGPTVTWGAPDPIGATLDHLRDGLNGQRRTAQSPGAPPYRPCGMSDERKSIGTYDVHGGRRAFMVCGNREYGFEHIKGRHLDDWSNKALITGDQWMNLMDYSIEAALRHPEATSNRDGKTCYARKIWMYDKRNGESTGNYFWNNVIVKDSNGDIITAYPTSAAHRCVG
ncbi:hypothetical protein [Nocardia sp. NBC_01329]|uniref:hypothetical protein n=1 Tax=Nocardia sp. NBC_01329 TaxID=2903594 RepID=UPI002E14B76E|nr:hypothetical protein OG405_03215 [Nocardia sp. NBC_01329]